MRHPSSTNLPLCISQLLRIASAVASKEIRFLSSFQYLRKPTLFECCSVWCHRWFQFCNYLSLDSLVYRSLHPTSHNLYKTTRKYTVIWLAHIFLNVSTSMWKVCKHSPKIFKKLKFQPFICIDLYSIDIIFLLELGDSVDYLQLLHHLSSVI